MEAAIDIYSGETQMGVQTATTQCTDVCSEVLMSHNPALSLVHRFDPLVDPRWDNFLARHPRASLFHSSPWLKALQQTYGYPATGFTTSGPNEDLKNAVVFCQVESWLTGRRLVSLPFSDHCEPLVDRPEDMAAIVKSLEEETRTKKWQYVELRSLSDPVIPGSLCLTKTQYNFHEIDLRPSLPELFASFHKDSIQRKIRRAEREKLFYDEGTSDKLLEEFYQLLTSTRRRHHVPPQSKGWFENLRACFKDDFKIRIARKDGKPLATMLTLRHKESMVYKYGGSDAQHNNLGPMHLLYWMTIQDAKAQGLRFFDLGRTDAGQTGLITFKNRWGARKLPLTYSRLALFEYPSHLFEESPSKVGATIPRKLIAFVPNSVASLIGRLLYKHIG